MANKIHNFRFLRNLIHIIYYEIVYLVYNQQPRKPPDMHFHKICIVFRIRVRHIGSSILSDLRFIINSPENARVPMFKSIVCKENCMLASCYKESLSFLLARFADHVYFISGRYFCCSRESPMLLVLSALHIFAKWSSRSHLLRRFLKAVFMRVFLSAWTAMAGSSLRLRCFEACSLTRYFWITLSSDIPSSAKSYSRMA